MQRVRAMGGRSVLIAGLLVAAALPLRAEERGLPDDVVPTRYAIRLRPDLAREVIETDLTGMFLVTQAALPLLSRGGTIVNNLSMAATHVFAGQSAYCAAKHGALGFTRALREELRPRGIRVVALMPGATDTEIWQQFWPGAPRERMLRPESVAQAVLDALLQPPESTVEEITLMPTGGAL